MLLVLKRTNVLGVGVSSINMDEAVELLLDARAHGKQGYVCVTGVHGVIESQRDPELKAIHNRSFMTVPDGMPTVWMGREQGFVHMNRVYGPDLMLEVCNATSGVGGHDTAQRSQDGHQTNKKPNSPSPKVSSNYLYPSQDETGPLDLGNTTPPHVQAANLADTEGFSHFLYGSTLDVLEKLKENLERKFPDIRIVGTFSPPFRPLNEDEEKELQRVVAICKPDFFWVGLSTPKQERFMANHSPATDDAKCKARSSESSAPIRHVPCFRPRYPLDAGIMLGVGAAFDIHAGLLKDAPEWIKNSGLQWFFRLCQEPNRLWRRYLDIVPKFLWLAFLQILGIRRYDIEE